MDYKIKQFINDLTLEVIRAFDIEIPITNIEEIVSRMGGRVTTDSSLGEYSDGRIQKVDNRFEIVVSPYQSDKRRNFTIAHELGHLFLHMGYLINNELWDNQIQTYYRKGNSQEEYEANEFAAALLMPKEEYKRVMDRNTNGNLVYTAKIADYFNVSVKAASNRGKFLEYLEW